MYKTKTVKYIAKSADEDIGKKIVEMLERELKPIHEILKKEIRLNDDMDNNNNARANGANRRPGRKPGARATNSALAIMYIRIMRCYIAQWHSGIKSRPIRHFLCHGRW